MNTNCAIDLVSPERIQRIRELAKKATPGPWVAVNGNVCLDYDPGRKRIPSMYNPDYNTMVCQVWDCDFWSLLDSAESRNIAEYIASVHPGVVLALCEEIEMLRKQVILFNKEADWLAEHMPKTSMIDGKAKVQCLRGMKEWREMARKAVEEDSHE